MPTKEQADSKAFAFSSQCVTTFKSELLAFTAHWNYLRSQKEYWCLGAMS